MLRFKILLPFLGVILLSGCYCSGCYDPYYRDPCCIKKTPLWPVRQARYAAPCVPECAPVVRYTPRCVCPKSMECPMLYMEQWDDLAHYISNEVLCGLGANKTVSVSGSGVSTFKKGLRELLITALTRQGVRIVDTEVGHPVLEFDILPVSQRQKNLYIGMRNKPTQIMVNMSILDNGQYIYRSSTIHAVPGGDLYQYVEDETPQAAPFKSYQLVAS